MKTIHSIQAFNEMLMRNKKILLNFRANWCPNCKKMIPILNRVELEIEEIEIYDVQVDDLREMVYQYEILSIPTLLFLKDGIEKDRIIGIHSPQSVMQFIRLNNDDDQ